MAKPILSPDQQSVVDARRQSILVSAAAGSGKTRVLTERIVGRVTDKENPIDIDRVLVVTFTNAAAREMKERIGKELNEQIALNPDNTHLQRQATLIHGAQITTIDSFCLYLVKNHFHKIDLDPSFRIASEGEMKLLKEDVMKDVIKRAYASNDEEFFHFVDCYSKKDKDDSLEQSIQKLFTYSMSYPWPEKWLEDHRNDYTYESKEDLESSELIKEIKKHITKKLDSLIKKAEYFKKLSLASDGPYTYEATADSDIAIMTGLKSDIESMTWDALVEKYKQQKFDRISTKKVDCNPDAKAFAKGVRDGYKDEFDSLTGDFLQDNMEALFAGMKAADRVVNKITDLVEDFIHSFEMEKRNRGVIDFSDMEHMAVKILIEDYQDNGTYTPTDVALSYRDFFEEVMVDEYQDSNLVQELIIKSVSRDNETRPENRFMVGDVKQSIYRFRLARPEIFMKKLYSFSKDKGAKERLITLKANYRSRGAVLESVNSVFEKIMTEDTGVIYDEDARLYKGGSFTGDTAAHRTSVVLVKQTDESTDEARILEANVIAKKILQYKNEFLLDDGSKADYRDMAVLFRSPSKWLDCIKEAFEKNNIPYHIEGVGAFYETIEISQVISFLKVLDNPLDDIALYATMTSTFGGMTDEECALIKGSVTSGRFLWDKTREYAKLHEDSKASKFVEMIGKYRHLATVVPIHELILRLFNETGYKHIVAALPNGKQRLANVEMLITKAAEYAKTSFYGLFHFLRYVELMKKIDEDEGEANTFDETANVVKVMSIHKSKGLEFPICIIGDIDAGFNEKDLSAEFVLDIDDGIGASAIDPKRRLKAATIRKRYIKEKCRRENIGEEIRILYVGMTRAKEKLVLVGLEKKPEDYLEKCVPGETGSYLKLIHEALHENKGTLFDTEIVDSADIASLEIQEDISLEDLKEAFYQRAKAADPNLIQTIKEKLEFKYPYENLSKLYTKTTVSELKMAAIELNHEEAEAYHPFSENESREFVPLFAGGESEVKGTDRGTAYHNLLQLIDFKALPTDRSELKNTLDTQIEAILNSKHMSGEDIDKVNRQKILEFLNTDVAYEMAEADRMGNLYKEQPFVISVPASEVDSDFPDTEEILVQGVIDVYYIKDGRIKVLDYKTDRVSEGAELVRRYKKQLDYYGKAITKLTGLLLESELIYSFALNEIIEVND